MWHHGLFWGPMGGWGFGGGGVIFWLVIVLVIVAAVAWYRSSSSGTPWPHGEKRSRGLDLLEERYARGEINRDEYLEKKRDLLG